MTKRTHKRSAKHNAEHVQAAATTKTLTPREQLLSAFVELKDSTALLFETALNEAQLGAQALLAELKTRTATWLSLLKQTTRIARPSSSNGEASHSGNPALS
jgi:hypothetical protein